MKKEIIANLTLLFITLIWGSGFAFTKIILDAGISTFDFLWFRMIMASLMLLPFIIKFRNRITSKAILSGIVIGCFLYLAFAFQTVGLEYTTPAKNSFLTTLNVIFTPLLLLLIFRKKTNVYTVVGAILAFVGAGLMTLNEQFTIGIGDTLSIICAIMWSLHIIFISRYNNKHDVLVLTFVQFVVTALLSFISSFVAYGQVDLGDMSLPVFGAILYLALFGTIVAFGVQVWAQKYTEPSKASIIFTFEGVFGAMFSVIIYNEVLTKNIIFGGILIFLAVFLAETKLSFIFKKNELNQEIIIEPGFGIVGDKIERED